MQEAKEHKVTGKPAISPRIFRAYDIRGVVDSELTETAMEAISRALASEALDNGIDTLLVGFDGRLSSPRLSEILIAGIRSTGCHVVELGLIPTPLLYFATHRSPHRSGVMLTASHNPANYNGLKIVFNRNCLADNQIQSIRRRAELGNFPIGTGQLNTLDPREDYLNAISSQLTMQRQFKIVVDCGNAVPGSIAPELFERLQCQVSPLYCSIDGHFPNHHPDPTVAANLTALRKQVTASGADLGLAFDGDGDRLALVTETGEIIGTDRLLMLLARAILPSYPGAAMVFDVKCSSKLAQLIRELGGEPVMHRSGHSPMKQKMQETGAPLGGEYAAHVFIKDRWFGYDDGLYTAARVLEILSKYTGPVSAAFADFHSPVSTPELFIPVDESNKFKLIEKLQESCDFPGAEVITMDGIRVEYLDGWGLIRASNTSPALSLRFEAETSERLDAIAKKFKALLSSVDDSLDFQLQLC